MIRGTAETTALQVKALLDQLSPLIEEHTRTVCPACTDVCCRQKHGMHLQKDLAYLSALHEPAPERDPARPGDSPCQFLGPEGCSLPRWKRAWKCTWYFCDPLLSALEQGPRKKARLITSHVDAIIRLRSML